MALATSLRQSHSRQLSASYLSARIQSILGYFQRSHVPRVLTEAFDIKPCQKPLRSPGRKHLHSVPGQGDQPNVSRMFYEEGLALTF